MENGATVRIQLDTKAEIAYNFPLNINDNKIILAAFLLKEKGESVVFLSKDFAARIKAEAMGLEVQDYQNVKYAYESIYRGIRKLERSKHEIDLFYKDGARWTWEKQIAVPMNIVL